MLEEKLGNVIFNDIHYETFNNHSEQGFVLKINEDQKNLYIWACQCRNSDEIMVVIGENGDCDINNMYSENAYKIARYFKYNDYDSAVDSAYNYIKYLFKNNFNKESHFKFDTYKSIEDIRKIKNDAETFSYGDYYELASFFDEEKMYSCDVIILNGKFGYRYNKHSVEDGMENLHFEETNPSLDDELSLLLDMRNKLNNFVESILMQDIEDDVIRIKI